MPLAVPLFGPLSMQPSRSSNAPDGEKTLAVPLFGPLSMQRGDMALHALPDQPLAVPLFGPLSMQLRAGVIPAVKLEDLAVPLFGPLSMQLYWADKHQALRPSCSTLVRAVIDATEKRDVVVMILTFLAVPLFGPLSMQRDVPFPYGAHFLRLQYPCSGRYRCNENDKISGTYEYTSCSTLVRAVIDATQQARAAGFPWGSCSTLVRAVIDATA